MNKNKHKRKRNERRIREKQDMKKQQPNTGMEKKREIITTGICVCAQCTAVTIVPNGRA